MALVVSSFVRPLLLEAAIGSIDLKAPLVIGRAGRSHAIMSGC